MVLHKPLDQVHKGGKYALVLSTHLAPQNTSYAWRDDISLSIGSQGCLPTYCLACTALLKSQQNWWTAEGLGNRKVSQGNKDQ